jgi:hypothetical protein
MGFNKRYALRAVNVLQQIILLTSNKFLQCAYNAGIVGYCQKLVTTVYNVYIKMR